MNALKNNRVVKATLVAALLCVVFAGACFAGSYQSERQLAVSKSADAEGNYDKKIDIHELDTYSDLLKTKRELEDVFPDQGVFDLIQPYCPVSFVKKSVHYTLKNSPTFTFDLCRYMAVFQNSDAAQGEQRITYGLLERTLEATPMTYSRGDYHALYYVEYRGYTIYIAFCDKGGQGEESKTLGALYEDNYSHLISLSFQYGDNVWCAEWGALAGEDGALAVDAAAPEEAYEKLAVLLDATLDKAGADPSGGEALLVGKAFASSWLE